MSSARSRKFKNDFNDRLDRAKVAKNPRLYEERLEAAARRAEMQPIKPFRTGGGVGSWKEFHKYLGGKIRDYDVGLGNGGWAAQVRNGEVVQEQGIRPDQRLILNNEVWIYQAPQRGRNETPPWEVHFAPDPTVRFENMDAPVAPKEPDICDIINLDK